MDKSEIVSICHRVYEKGFVAATDGNISAVNDRGTIYITRSAVCKGEVEEKDILEIDFEGQLISGTGKVTTENKLHLFVYANRKEVKAVVHCHPVYTSAFAVAGKPIDHYILPEVILSLGKISLCEYGSPGIDELPLSIKPFVGESNAFILKNHGALTIGESLKQAYYRMEKLEHTAKIQLMALSLGGAQKIPEDKIQKLISYAKEVYGVDINKNIFK
ncbi:MAG: class II aldolase/adducin family protein [Bacteroidota bacterium]|nr:class II aldolase/adducin family protein [Bacteroidota bacterium]